jgi:hypothetical protein
MNLFAESVMAGDFRGWRSENIYALENGQKWQQVRDEDMLTHLYRPRVKVWWNGARYFLEVEGMNEMIEVRPVG